MEYPNRVRPRLKQFSYKEPGYYFVTINTYRNRPLLSSGDIENNVDCAKGEAVSFSLLPIGMELTRQIEQLPERFPSVLIDRYVVMPTHIHLIVALKHMPELQQVPSLCDVICALKSLTTRTCNQAQNCSGRKIFQDSFYEEIIRTERAYQAICHYIENNPYKLSERMGIV